MDTKKFVGKFVAECSKDIQTAKRGLHRNVNGYLYATFQDVKSKQKFNVFLTKACSANFDIKDKPWRVLKFIEAPLSTGEVVVKLGMGSLEFESVEGEL